MLIIFDLDDTLVETSSSVTPLILKHIFYEWMKQGLVFKNPEEELLKFLKMNKKAISSKSVIKKFLNEHNAYEKFYEFSIKELQKGYFLEHIRPKKNVKKILCELRKNHILALVSIGDSDIQKKKLINAGINVSIFNKIEIVKSDKRACYKKMIEEEKIDPKNVLVCGDRKSDLEPAKDLGCICLLMRGGRDNYEKADYFIEDLEQIRYIIRKILGEKNGF